MGRGQGKAETISARRLLYGRGRGPGPAQVVRSGDLAGFANLVLDHLAEAGYIDGDSRPRLNQQSRPVFDLSALGQKEATRLYPDQDGDYNGLVLETVDWRQQTRRRSGEEIISLQSARANISDLDQVENELLARANKIDLDYVERELIWPDLKKRLDQGQRLELCVAGKDEENTAYRIRRYLSEYINYSTVDQQAASALIYQIGSVKSDDPAGYLEAMYQSQLGRDLLAGRGLWRVRRHRRDN